jgi:hypothetical protein
MSEQERQQGLRRIIQRVVVSRAAVHITFHPSGDPVSSAMNRQTEMDEDEESSVMAIEVPFTLVPRGGNSRVLFNGVPGKHPSEPNAVLIQAVVHGYQWREQLLRGPERTLKDFAQEQGVTPRYLMRLLRVSFLAPDILEAMVGGTQPATMTLERFRRPIPLEWWQQRQLFGFPSREPTSLLSSQLHPGRH